MAINNSQVPADVLQTFYKGVESLLAANEDPLRARLMGARISAIATSVVGLDQIMTDAQTLSVTRTGWRLVANDADGFMLSADVAVRNGVQRVVSISKDERAGHLASLIADVARRFASDDGNHAVTLVRIPGVLVDALMITAANGEVNQMIPIRGPEQVFEPGQPLDVTDFLDRIRKPRPGTDEPSLLDAFLEFDNLPGLRSPGSSI